MNELEPTETRRTVMLSVEVSTDQELADVHATLSRIAVGYICGGLEARVLVMTDDEDDEPVELVGGPIFDEAT